MKLRFGLIGLGHHGRNAVAPAFYQDGVQAELAAVCDLRPEAIETYDRPVTGKFTDYHAMLRDGGLDAVYVAAGMDLHFGIVMGCLDAGMHVVVEKPMAATLEQCRGMVDRAAERGRVLAVNFESRYSEQNEILRAWIKDGHFGRIEALHFANMWDGHKRFGPIKERRARLMALAGALDCGIHKLDQARFLVGGTWSHVEALGAWLDEEFDPPPHIGILGQLSNGAMVTVNASLSWAANIKSRPMVNTLEIAGTEGVALCRSTPDFRRMSIELHSNSLCEERTIDCTNHTSDIVLLLNEFAGVVSHGRTEATILATGDDGYWAQYATEMANASAMKHRIPVS